MIVQGSAGSPREVHLDYLRAVSIILIVCIHAFDGVWAAATTDSGRWWLVASVETAIRTGLPMFFMISGALLLRGRQASSLGEYYSHRLPKVVIPLLAYSVLYAAWDARNDLSSSTPIEIFTSTLNGPVAYHLWFMYSLLGLYIAAPFVRKMTDALSTRWLALLCALMVGSWATRIYGVPFGIALGLQDLVFNGWVVYFLLGVLLTRINAKTHLGAAIAVGVAGFAATLAILRWRPHELGAYIFDLSPTMAMMCASIFIIFRAGSSLLPTTGFISASVLYVARNGLGIYLIHAAVLRVLSERAADLAPTAPSWVTVPTIVVLTVAVSIPGALAIDRLALGPAIRFVSARLDRHTRAEAA